VAGIDLCHQLGRRLRPGGSQRRRRQQQGATQRTDSAQGRWAMLVTTQIHDDTSPVQVVTAV
jgi:hypothetical protein